MTTDACSRAREDGKHVEHEATFRVLVLEESSEGGQELIEPVSELMKLAQNTPCTAKNGASDTL